MSILIKGKTICHLCGRPIHSQGDFVGFPFIYLPDVLSELSDSCVHRSCLEGHPLKNTIAGHWSNYWKAQAQSLDADAFVSTDVVLFFVKRRLVFVWFDDFIEIEERREDFEELKGFFAHAKQGQQSELVLDWNHYKIASDDDSVQLCISANPRNSNVVKNGLLQTAEHEEILNYRFNKDSWSAFISSWNSMLHR
jgi:hypothetical protein